MRASGNQSQCDCYLLLRAGWAIFTVRLRNKTGGNKKAGTQLLYDGEGELQVRADIQVEGGALAQQHIYVEFLIFMLDM